MVITVAVAAAVLAAMAGYLAVRGRGVSAGALGEGDAKRGAGRRGALSSSSKKKGVEPSLESKDSAFDGLPLALGDVVSANGEERWLCGALVAREGERVVGVLFVAPEGAQTKAVAVFSPPRRDILWLSPVGVAVPSEPPATLEIASVMMMRRARFPVVVERLGQGAPSVGAMVLWALYEGAAGESALLIVDGSAVHAFSGVRLEPNQYDRMGSSGIDDEF